MAFSISYSEAPTASSLAQRGLRLVSLVASFWIVAGSSLAFWPVQSITPLVHRLHVLGLGCLLISGGLYSAVLPLHYLLRRHRP